MVTNVYKLLLLAGAGAIAFNAQAFDVDPWALHFSAERAAKERAAAMKGLGAEHEDPKAIFDPVHEQMTLRSLAVATGKAADDWVGLAGTDSGRSMVYGVRWNDSPYVVRTGAMYWICRVKKQAANSLPCWGSQWLYGTTHPQHKVDDKTSLAMIVRSHFYDMQFLHAMSEKDVQADEVREKILMWAELVALIQAGMVVDDTRFEQVVPMLSTTARIHWAELFPARPGLPNNKNMAKWRVGTMFRADRDRSAYNLKDVALGSFLHIVQDSYAGGHTEREMADGDRFAWGDVREFHTYQGQNKTWHSCNDHNPINAKWAAAAGDKRNPVSVGANVIQILRSAKPGTDPGMADMRDKVSAAFLNLADPARKATIGDTAKPACS